MTPAEFRTAWRGLFSAETLLRLDERKAREAYRRERGLPERPWLPLSFYGTGEPPPPAPAGPDPERLAALIAGAVAAAMGQVLAAFQERLTADVLKAVALHNGNGNGHARRR